jgi:hypothetical protein
MYWFVAHPGMVVWVEMGASSQKSVDETAVTCTMQTVHDAPQGT